jgi:PAS domain S-box-containing protein
VKNKDKSKNKRLKGLASAPKKTITRAAKPIKCNGDEGIENAGQADLQRRLDQFLALQKVFTSIQSTMDLNEVVRKVAEAIVNILGYDHSFVTAFDTRKNAIAETAFFSKANPELAKEVEKSIIQAMKGAGNKDSAETANVNPIAYNDAQDAEDESSGDYEYNAVQELLGAKSMIAMPLIARDRLVGTILAFTKPEDVIESTDESLWILANQAAIAIDNVRLYDEALVNTQKLRESRETSRITLEHAVTGVCIVQDAKFQYVNPIFADMVGYSNEELIGTCSTDYVYPEDREKAIQHTIDSLKGKSNLPYQFRLIKKDGGIVWVLEKVVSFKYKAKRAALAIALDITELKRVEEALQESEEKLRIVFDSIKDGIVVTDLKVNMLQVNEAARRLAGYPTKEDMIGQNALGFITSEDIEKAMQPMPEAVQGRPIERGEFKLRNIIGEEFDVEIGVSMIHDTAGNLTGFVAILHDITERKRMENTIRASEEKLRFMFESIDDCIVVTDLDGNIVDENMAGVRMFGYTSKDEFIGTNSLICIAGKDRDAAKLSMLSTFKEKKGSTREFTLVRKDGSDFEGEISTAILRDGAGSPSGFICVIRDVTVRKRIDQAKSDFVALVSHQLKTPVAGIRGYIENILDGLAGDLTEKQKQYMLDMRKLCIRNYNLISDLLNTSMIERGIVTIDLGPAKLNDVIDTVVEDYYERAESKGVALKVDGLNKTVIALADRDKLVEVLSNVVNNAIKFTDQGSITIGLKQDSEFGIIEIKDTGRGMSDETMQDLFKKEKVLSGGPVAGGGAGLGLYIAKGFMHAQHGDIAATSFPGNGSCFVIKVPLYTDRR